MKRINKTSLALSLLTLIVACSLLSMFSVAKEYRFTLVAMNPWNGVEGIAFTIQYFLHTGKAVTWLVTGGALLVIWWRLYAIFNRSIGKG